MLIKSTSPEFLKSILAAYTDLLLTFGFSGRVTWRSHHVSVSHVTCVSH